MAPAFGGETRLSRTPGERAVGNSPKFANGNLATGAVQTDDLEARLPVEPRSRSRGVTAMTNDKKLNLKNLSKVKGGAAKAGVSSGMAKASAGRTNPAVKGVSLGSKRP